MMKVVCSYCRKKMGEKEPFDSDITTVKLDRSVQVVFEQCDG